MASQTTLKAENIHNFYHLSNMQRRHLNSESFSRHCIVIKDKVTRKVNTAIVLLNEKYALLNETSMSSKTSLTFVSLSLV